MLFRIYLELNKTELQILDVNIPGYDSIPPISIAAKHNSLAAFEVLISCGAKVDLQDVDGNTTLHEASKFGHVRMCEVYCDGTYKLRSFV